MAIQTSLLQHENNNLRGALINKKKRRKRGKLLLLEAPKEYNSSAVFWSPSKVQRAIDLQAEKDTLDEAKKLEKDKKLRLREESKREKAQLIEERKVMRQVA